jgi:hypothetical protein
MALILLIIVHILAGIYFVSIDAIRYSSILIVWVLGILYEVSMHCIQTTILTDGLQYVSSRYIYHGVWLLLRCAVAWLWYVTVGSALTVVFLIIALINAGVWIYLVYYPDRYPESMTSIVYICALISWCLSLYIDLWWSHGLVGWYIGLLAMSACITKITQHHIWAYCLASVTMGGVLLYLWVTVPIAILICHVAAIALWWWYIYTPSVKPFVPPSIQPATHSRAILAWHRVTDEMTGVVMVTHPSVWRSIIHKDPVCTEMLLWASIAAVTLVHICSMIYMLMTWSSVYIIHKIIVLLTAVGAMIVYYRLYSRHVQRVLYGGLLMLWGSVCLLWFILVAWYTLTLGGIVFLILYYGCIYIGIYESSWSMYIHPVHTDGLYRSSMYMTMLSCLGVAWYIAMYPWYPKVSFAVAIVYLCSMIFLHSSTTKN